MANAIRQSMAQRFSALVLSMPIEGTEGSAEMTDKSATYGGWSDSVSPRPQPESRCPARGCVAKDHVSRDSEERQGKRICARSARELLPLARLRVRAVRGGMSAPRGRPPREVSLEIADRLRASGLSWASIAQELGVARETLRVHRSHGSLTRREWKRGPAEVVKRAHLPHQAQLLRAASRYLKANLGQGLTPLEFKDAKGLVRLIGSVYRENDSLRDALSKARLRIRDLERMLAA